MCHQLSWQVRCHINLWSEVLAWKGHCRSGLNVPWRRKTASQTVCDLCEFYAAGAASPLWMTLTNSPSVLTYKSLSRKLSGHRVSDMPEVISLSLIGDLKKLKKKGLPLEVKPSRQQHRKHILCFGLIQLDIHWSFSCFQASLINFVVNSCACSCYFSPCVCSRNYQPFLSTL